MIGNTPGWLQPSFTFHMLVKTSVALCCVFALAACGKKSGPTGPAPRNVLIAKVTTKDVPFYLDEIGTTMAFETVQVQAQVTGQIISREFKDGADVKKGDLLFKIDPRPYQAALAAAQADHALADANLKRMAVLDAKNVSATQEMDNAKANAMRTEAAVAAAQVNLDFLQHPSSHRRSSGIAQRRRR